MLEITAREASQLILGPNHDRLREADRLLAAGEVEAAVNLLENAIAGWNDTGGGQVEAISLTLQRGLELLDRYSIGYDALVPTSDGDTSTTWEYRFTSPPQGWSVDDDNHSGWTRDTAPFASYSKTKNQTAWPAEHREIWIRTSFTGTPDALKYLILAFVDERAEFFLNGQQVAASSWMGGRYERLVLPSNAVVRPGRNLLAIHCFNQNGGAGIDAGLYVKNNQQLDHRLYAAAVKAMTDQPDLQPQRAMLYVQLERWQEAADEMCGYVRSNPAAKSVEWMQAATLLAAAVRFDDRRVDAHHLFCGEMLAKFGKSTEISSVEQTLKSCLLLPGMTDLDQHLVDRVRNAVEQVSDPRKVTWMANASALAAYRSGDFSLGSQLAEVAEDSSGSTWASVAENATALAKAIKFLSAAATGQDEDAQEILTQLRSNSGSIPRHPDGSPVGVSFVASNNTLRTDVLIIQLLVAEAQQLLSSLPEHGETGSE